MNRTARLDTLRAYDPAAQAPLTLDARAEADLRRIVGTHDELPSTVRRPRRRLTAGGPLPRRRLAVALTAGGALVAAVAVAVPMIGGEQTTSPAYAVTDAGDGTISVTVYRMEDPEGLERRLAQAGLRAEIVYFAPGLRCERTPRGVGFPGQWSTTDNWDGRQSPGQTWTLKPADFKDATFVLEATDNRLPAQGDWVTGTKMGFLTTGTFGPCVLKPVR
ncbi:hypothetical protein [Kribbella endophytica]